MKRFLILAALCAACGGDDDADSLDCEVAIIGGGAGGLHTAYRLAPEMGEGVCLFEKESQLGGRIHDVPMDEDDPGSPVFGTGARRVMEGQEVLFALAEELDLTLETPDTTGDLVNTRGLYAFSKEALLPAYPTVTPDASGDTETAFYEALMLDANVADADDYSDFRAYVRGKLGEEEYAFLRDVSRFRADFLAPLDARGYMDYFLEEWDVCCTPSYPVGGMSAFIRGMEEAATADGARIFVDQMASEVSRDGDGYRVQTVDYTVHADRVVIAVPPVAFDWFTGDVAEEIRAAEEYQAIIGIKVVTVTQWWPSRWWEVINDPNSDPAGQTIWRAWSNEHCFNFIEIPLEQYGVDQMVTRSVYNDDPDCSEFWEELYRNGGVAAVENEIKLGMEHMFVGNGVSAPDTLTIPDPVKTHVQIWPAGWHWVRAGFQGTTNQDVFDWAVEPLPGEDVAMVGEAYHPNRSGWSDAAYKSSINLLNTRYGLSLPTARTQPPARRGAWSLHRN
jgi:hypothetical protein